MAKTFNIPAAERKLSQQIDYFLGVDMSNTPGTVAASRSPQAPNMIRDQVGRVRKRMGYKTLPPAAGSAVPEGVVHGWHNGCIAGQAVPGDRLLHIGTKLYSCRVTAEDELQLACIYTGMANRRSVSFRWGDKLYIMDGHDFLEYSYREGGYQITSFLNASDSAGGKMPTLMISTSPAGAGTVYEPVNMLSPWFEQTFLSDGEATAYHLCQQGLDQSHPPTVQILSEDGEWQITTDYTVDYAGGIINFRAAPAASPVSGMDNVSIVAAKQRTEDLQRICGCTVLGVYGVGGKPDRIFISGNPDYPGYEWYSGFEDPTYFPDTSYNRLARDGAQIIGYVVVNARLAAFLSGSADGRNCIVRSGELDDEGEALFAIKDTLIGESPVAAGSFSYLGTEPLFLTERGIYAVTPQEITGEKYSQLRSYYINKWLDEARFKADAIAVTFGDFYVLALDGCFYILDGLQKSYEKNSPYSSYQYECYYFPDMAASALWVDEGRLWFGTADGKIRRFYDDKDNPGSYNDDGEAIDAYWETTDFDGKLFFHAKTYGYLAVRLAAAPLTGCKIFAQRRGLWSMLMDTKEKARYFSWEYIDFEKFVFSADTTPRTVGTKIKIKKVDKIRFRIRNNELNEPFGLYDFGFQWKEPGRNYKR